MQRPKNIQPNRPAPDGYPKGLPQPAASLTYKLNGAQVGRGNILNIAGSGITATPLDDGITYNLSGGGGGSPAGSPTWVQWNLDGLNLGADGDFVRATDGSYFGVNSAIAVGKETRFAQDSNLLGLGIDGIFDGYSDNGFATSFLGMLAGDFTSVGGSDNSMIIGHQPFVPGSGQATTNYGYDTITGEADLEMRVSRGSTQVSIGMSADGVTESLDFRFTGGQQYNFPSTTPNTGDVLTAVSPGLLDWVPGSGSTGITIGDPITGGGANRVLYEDGSNNLAESSSFAYNDSTGVFAVTFGGGNRLLIDPNANRYEIGDSNGINNKNYLVIDDGANTTTFGTSQFWQVIDSNTATQWITVDSPNSIVKIGDANNALNGNRLIFQDAGNKITMNISSEFEILDNTSNFRYLDINPGNNQYAIGDLNNFLNFNYFTINDFAQQSFLQTLGTFAVQTIGGQRGLSVDFSGGTDFTTQFGDVDGGNNGTKITTEDANFRTYVTNRFELARGSAVTAASTTTLDNDGNTFEIQGNTTINLIDGTNWTQGSEIILQFTGSPTLKHNQTPSAGNLSLFLAGSVDFAITNLTTMKFVRIGSVWYELCRTVA